MHAPVPDVTGARSLYASIDGAGAPFAMIKRELGLGYIAWRSNDRDLACQHARRAVSHAGDGGLVRQRAIALRLLSKVAFEAEAADAAARSAALAAALEDEDLANRLSSPAREEALQSS